MAQTTTLRWVTDTGVAGEDVMVAVLATPQTSTLRWVTSTGVAAEPVTVTVNDDNPLTERSGTASISVAATVTGEGHSSSAGGASTISVSSTVTSSGTKGAVGNGYIDWYGEVTAEGEADLPPNGTGSISVTSALSSAGTKAGTGTGTITGVTDVRNTNDERRGFIDAEAELTASGTPAKAGRATIAVLHQIDGVGVELVPGVISGQSRLRGMGTKGGEGSGSVPAPTNELTGSAEKGALGTFILNVLALLEGVGASATRYFTPPAVEGPRAAHPLFRYYDGIPRGQTVLKTDGFYVTVSDPDPEDIEAADEVYLGGRSYAITDSEAQALTTAGYGDYISTDS